MSNSELKSTALSSLKGNWGTAILATLVYGAIIAACSSPSYIFNWTHPELQNELTSALSYNDTSALMGIYGQTARYTSLGFLLTIFLGNVLSVGFANSFYKFVSASDDRLTANMFEIAFRNYWHKVWGMLLKDIFVALWTCLLIIPGIIKVFSYAMTPYILEERPELSASESIDRSRAMMKGHKFDLFYLYLSFIGWFLLSILSCGIGFFWLFPYVESAVAAFYKEVKAEYEEISL